MKTQDNRQKAIQDAERLRQLFRQQDTTANACGFVDWCQWYVKTYTAKNRDYSSLAYNAATYFDSYKYLYERLTADDLLKCF